METAEDALPDSGGGTTASVRCVEIKRASADVSCGFHLSRSKWDPYPWVSGVEERSPADEAGLKTGDCLLEVNGEDLVGRRICDVAELVRAAELVELMLWTPAVDSDCSPETLCCGPMPLNMQRLSTCVASVVGYLECPVCLTTICPPACQCVNGHLLCIRCHARSERCPICRVKLSRGRCLFADQVFNSLIESFNLSKQNDQRQISDKIRRMFKQESKWKNLPLIKVSKPKSLTSLLVQKASSAENLSGSDWRQIQSNGSKSKTFLCEPTSLKTKSLSACDISTSRISSRSCSRNNLQQAVSIERVPLFEEAAANRTYHCPFDATCCERFRSVATIDHFQTVHSGGPLVQYFTPHVVFKLFDSHESTYCFNVDNKRFFLKILKCSGSSTSFQDGILIWMWFLGDQQLLNEYHLDINIAFSSKPETSLINFTSAMLSLENWSWENIISHRKGTFISMDTITALNKCANEDDTLNLGIRIRHSNEHIMQTQCH